MQKLKVEKYKEEVCPHCHQTASYLIGIDKGCAETLLQILQVISKKGINEIHPSREINWKDNQKWKLTNLSRNKFHGLIAPLKDKKGYYCLTKKAGKFLRGEAIPRYLIRSKITKHNEQYWKPEENLITFIELLSSSEIPIWDGAEQNIINLIDPVEQLRQQTLNFNFVLRQQVIN